ncbi:MAG: MBL fold metallo-hydrolase [Firmicutes bacterium ML8_F2]|nr:MAG: MBL fold metallo-hydrolase [Firmicutes bacterium ML8_F2]
MIALQVLFYVILAMILLIIIFLLVKLLQLKSGKKRTAEKMDNIPVKKIPSLGTVDKLTVIPLVDYYTDNEELRTEAGVSYLIEVNDRRILMDTGLNKNREHPSPLLHNLHALGYSEKDIDLIFISHLHLDHVGGKKEEKNASFSISQGPVDLPKIPVYAPVPLKPSAWNPGPEVHVIEEPTRLDRGIASIGIIPRYLFLLGETLEHSLAVNVAGKGIVIIVGCGHQGIENILERTGSLFDEPIYGLIGGLHFPVNGGRMNIGPLNLQHIVASDDPPWKGLDEKKVEQTIIAIKNKGIKKIALSAHDSSDWSLDRFQNAFQDSYLPLKVGKKIII